MVDQMFSHEDLLFGVKVREGVMASYDDESKATTVFNLYVHDTHADVSDAVEREGVWVPLTTIHWKELRDNSYSEASGAEDLPENAVEEYVQGGAYERLINATTV